MSSITPLPWTRWVPFEQTCYKQLLVPGTLTRKLADVSDTSYFKSEQIPRICVRVDKEFQLISNNIALHANDLKRDFLCMQLDDWRFTEKRQ